MVDRHWFEPFAIWRTSTLRCSVSNVEEAAEKLLIAWPAAHRDDP